MADPVPQDNGLYAHDLFGPDGRKIEAYTPAPLTPDEIEQLFAQSYADRPDQNELARAIMEMEGPELPVEPAPEHVAPAEPIPQRPEPPGDPNSGADEFDNLRMWTDPYSGVIPYVTPDEREWARQIKQTPLPAPVSSPSETAGAMVQRPEPPGLKIVKDPPTPDDLARMWENPGKQWWQEDLGDDIPPQYRDLIEPMGQIQ